MKRLFKHLFVVPIVLAISVMGFVFFHYDDTAEKKADCAVIFGAAVWRDDIPSHALYDRIMTGVTLYKDDMVNCLILSGGKSKYGSHEVDVMKKIAIQNGVDESNLRLDYEGNNTEETIKNLDNLKKYIFVSNDFHLARIKLFAWRYNIVNYQMHHSDYQKGRYRKEPYFFMREVVAIFWYFKFEILLLLLSLYFLKRKGLVVMTNIWYFLRKNVENIISKQRKQ